MCFVKIEGAPAPVISCKSQVKEGMVVVTEDDEISELRRSIMEFELVNHPLDCPICDQAGERVLQDYAYTYGQDRSRYRETRRKRHTKVLGPNVAIYGQRCVVCTRCVRFCREVAGTGELTVAERGVHSVIDTFDRRLATNPSRSRRATSRRRRAAPIPVSRSSSRSLMSPAVSTLMMAPRACRSDPSNRPAPARRAPPAGMRGRERLSITP